MAVEYTGEAIDRIRSLARQGWPHGAVAAMMGWDVGRLIRMAEKHGISFWKIQAKSKTPDPVKAKIRWDAGKAWHGYRSVSLSEAEGRIFAAILKFGDYDWNVEKLAGATGLRNRNVPAFVSQLRIKLEQIGLTLSYRFYELIRT